MYILFTLLIFLRLVFFILVSLLYILLLRSVHQELKEELKYKAIQKDIYFNIELPIGNFNNFIVFLNKRGKINN